MQRPKTAATTVALVIVATGTAFALNLGVISATGPAAAGGESATEPEVVTVVVDVPVDDVDDTDDTTTTAAPVPASRAAPAAPPATAPAPPATVAPTTAAPTTAPPTTAAPTTTAAPAPTTEYVTYATGAGDVVIAHHGNTLEFWAAYPTGGWQYEVEDPTGREIEIDFRRGEDEAEFKVTLEGGRIRTESEGFGGGGDDD